MRNSEIPLVGLCHLSRHTGTSVSSLNSAPGVAPSGAAFGHTPDDAEDGQKEEGEEQ
jgi:hypothetical protein